MKTFAHNQSEVYNSVQKRLFLNKPIHITSKEHTRAHVRTQAVVLRALSYDALIGCVSRTNKLIKAVKKLAPKRKQLRAPCGCSCGFVCLIATELGKVTRRTHTRVPKTSRFSSRARTHTRSVCRLSPTRTRRRSLDSNLINTSACLPICVRACVFACVLACLRACVRACLRACVKVRACVNVRRGNGRDGDDKV